MARTKVSNAGDVTALVIFVDIRGFTGWSDTPEVFASLNKFAQGFNDLIKRHFAEAHLIKPLGDGAMIVRELKQSNAPKAGTVGATLKTIRNVEAEFDAYCRRFQDSIGHETTLNLGWGITCGKVKTLKGDYVGSNVNKAARLCDAARPFGIVLDKFDFPELPPDIPFNFYEQTRKLSGLTEAKAWVTAEIFAGFVPREKLKQSPEVHVAGMCIDRKVRGTIRLLIAKRSPDREFFPNKYEGCGGQLSVNETFEAGVQRHFLKEMGIEVNVLTSYHCFYVIRETLNPIIPGIRFLCEQTDDREPKSIRHSTPKWITEADFKNMSRDEFVGDLKDEVLVLLQAYKKEFK